METSLFSAVLTAIGFLFMVCASSGAIVYGAATVCRWMKWAPVNIIVNVNMEREGGP